MAGDCAFRDDCGRGDRMTEDNEVGCWRRGARGGAAECVSQGRVSFKFFYSVFGRPGRGRRGRAGGRQRTYVNGKLPGAVIFTRARAGVRRAQNCEKWKGLPRSGKKRSEREMVRKRSNKFSAARGRRATGAGR